MKARNFAGYHIRKWYSFSEETLANESGQLADGEPLYRYVIAAAIDNPYAGRFSQELSDLISDSPQLGEEFGRRIKALAGDRQVVSYGKACVIGSRGEYEHGNAFLTNPAADPVRVALGGGHSWVPSTGKHGAPGVSIDVPLAHKDALYVRSHYDTVSVSFGDGPLPDEVIIIWAFATRGRLHARLGGLTADAIKGDNGLT